MFFTLLEVALHLSIFELKLIFLIKVSLFLYHWIQLL